jgi:stage IV sporulation protein FB
LLVLRDALSWSFPIGQLFGIMIRVHLILPIVMVSLIARAALVKTNPAGMWQDATMLMIVMFFSVLLHEFGHCFAARFMDGEADEILMWPLGGLAFARSLPHTPSAHFVFTLGGPLVNLVLCLIAGLAIFLAFDFLPPFNPFDPPYRLHDNRIDIELSTWSEGVKETGNVLAIVLARVFWINWLLLLFNTVLVGLPFDGGHMLQAALWPRLGHYQSKKVAIYAGFVCAVLVGIYSIIYTEPMMAFLTIFIFVACAQEWMALESAHEDSLFGYDFSQGYTSLEKDEAPAPPKPKKQNFIQRWLAKRAAKKLQMEIEQREADERRMDDLLDKIQKHGKGSLTDEEQRFLKRVAERYKNKN